MKILRQNNTSWNVYFWKDKVCLCHCPDFHFKLPKTRKVATNIISYKRYREILFQKVASGYLLHFVQDGSSKHILDKCLLHINLNNPKVARPGFHLGALKNVKLRQKQFHMKDTGKSSSRKLRRAIYYTLYRMDAPKTHSKIIFLHKYQKSKIAKKNVYIPPP